MSSMAVFTTCSGPARTSPSTICGRNWGQSGGAGFLHHEAMLRVVDREGRTLVAYANPDRLEAHLMALSPADARPIAMLCDGVRRFAGFDMSLMQRRPRHLMTPLDWARVGRRMLPFASTLAGWGRQPASDFAQRFRDPYLRRAVAHMFGWPGIPMMVGASLLAYMHRGNAGFPAGGSLEFARALERRYLGLGGELVYRSQVERILVENGRDGRRRAAGVRLYDNSEHRADHVISAADGRGTIFDMLGGEFVDGRVRRTYDGHLPVQPQVQVSLGVRRDLSSEPHWAVHLLDTPILIAGEERHEVAVKNYCFDPSLAPPGRSVLIATAATSYGYWQRIYGRRLYDTEQTEASDTLVAFLGTLYPGIRAEIEVVDEATPLSYERYTGNWAGVLLRLASHEPDHAAPDPGHAAHPSGSVAIPYGRAVGRARRRGSTGGSLGPERGPRHLPRGRATVHHDDRLTERPGGGRTLWMTSERVGAAPSRRPASRRARRSRNSICPFRLRKSSAAHRWREARTSGSSRRRYGRRSAITPSFRVCPTPGDREEDRIPGRRPVYPW